jgi:hypothetical protein
MRALSEEKRDAWALHAVVHAYECMGRRYEGERLLRTARWWWDESALLSKHLHWHWALFQLESGHFEKAAFRYDAWMREGGSSDANDVADAASMLWRMELLGNMVYDRWKELLPHVRRRLPFRASAFVDVHAAMVLVAAGEEGELEGHLRAMRAFAFDAGTFYGPAHTTSVPTPSDRDLAADDPLWWAFVRRAGTGDEQRRERGEDVGGKEGDGVEKEAEGSENVDVAEAPSNDPPNLPVVSDGRWGAGDAVFVREGPESVEVSLHPVGMERVREEELQVRPRLDLTFGPADESAEDVMPTLASAGGRGRRPLLTAPFSVLPVLPLVAEQQGEDGEGSAGAELVSLGGVGGLGLGSHSLIDQRYVTAAVGVALAEGMVAYRRGEFEVAVSLLLPLRSMLHVVGGSTVQRDVFLLTLEAAATQSRQVLLARSLLRERLTRRPNAGLAQFHLSSVLYATGEHRLAGQARDRALRLGLGEARAAAVKTLGRVSNMQRGDDDWGGNRA